MVDRDRDLVHRRLGVDGDECRRRELAVPSLSSTKSITHSAIDWFEPDNDAVALVMLAPVITTGPRWT